MIDFIRDPAWQFGGFVSGILAIVLTLAIAFFSRRKKVLTYEFSPPSSIIQHSDQVESKLEMVYSGEKVKEISFVSIKIKNIGNLPIQISDFSSKISVNFTSNYVKILDVFPLAQPREMIPIDFEISDKTLFVKPLLLNSSDEISFGILGLNIAIESLSARILGIKKLEKRYPQTFKVSKYQFNILYWTALLNGMSFLVVIFFVRNTGVITPENTFSAFMGQFFAYSCILNFFVAFGVGFWNFLEKISSQD